ncbi:Nuclear cap-binding protein subunit 2 [Zea mays]|uniref:Nuclear cap-binding protein subunit 2 n=1 Tax=Zea mays TaxID=4577 RepID=A0A1D6Q4R1_MAIZE|nr:Nuclear cap-binding protein subunit 2 [Zea mays]
MRRRCLRRQRCTSVICPSTPRRSRPTSSSPAPARSRRSSWGSTRTPRPHAVSALYLVWYMHIYGKAMGTDRATPQQNAMGDGACLCYERSERKRGHGDSHRNDRGDYQRKRYRNDDRSAPEESKRAPDSDPAEKNPRFREKGDSDEEEDDYDGKRRR